MGQDWELRYAFCAKIASVCAYVGPTKTTEFVLPLIENATVDVEVSRRSAAGCVCHHMSLQLWLRLLWLWQWLL